MPLPRGTTNSESSVYVEELIGKSSGLYSVYLTIRAKGSGL